MVGFGYDLHRLKENESLILGGVNIEWEKGTVAHSDGDVLLHSIMDAVLGAAGLGDIGEHFPDTDIEYKNADSMALARKVFQMIAQLNYKIINIDATIVAEKPKMLNYKEQMKKNIAEIFSLNEQRVNIKATTNEKLGYLGNSEGIAVYSVCEIQSMIK
jgi:2-C-methyl-D-erythritol 2,4-cyclodiphosphate synthase